MSRIDETFFTSVGCMDGRVQEPILSFGQKKFKVLFADTITEAGLVGLLARLHLPSPARQDVVSGGQGDDGQAKENLDQTLINSLKSKILISLEKHHSKGIIVHGHEDCVGNPVDDEKHKEETLKSAKLLRTFAPAKVKIIPVFVKRANNTWIVEEV